MKNVENSFHVSQPNIGTVNVILMRSTVDLLSQIILLWTAALCMVGCPNSLLLLCLLYVNSILLLLVSETKTSDDTEIPAETETASS